MSEREARSPEYVKRLMETVKELRELLGRLPFDFDENKVGRSPEIMIPNADPGADETVMDAVRFEVEDVGQDPVEKVCRLICGNGEVVGVYSIVMREYQHIWAEDGQFSYAFWASAKLDVDKKFTLINGMILPAEMMDGWRFIPIDRQLNPDRRVETVTLADLSKIRKIVKEVQKTLPPRQSEVGGVALRLVE